VEQEASKKTDQALDSILEPGKKGQQQKNPIPQEQRGNQEDSGQSGPSSNSGSGSPDASNSSSSNAETNAIL